MTAQTVSHIQASASSAPTLKNTLVAIGGLNSDPYEQDPHIGRLRHVYVGHDYRRRGIARSLVHHILARNTQFGTIRLRTPNSDASRFYESIGFAPIDSPTATHIIIAK